MSRPLLLGHRGARARKAIPENTIASFDQALADGCDGFEFDVRLTVDGEAVVCHGPEFEGIEIADERAEKLSELPRLRDVLARYHERVFLDIELKVAGVQKIAIELLRKFPPRRGFVVSSFLPKALEAVHAEDAGIPLGLICETKAQLQCWSELPVDYVIPHRKLVTPTLIRRLKDARKKILVWTVNVSVDMKRYAALEVDGIISDNTTLLCKMLSK